MYCSRWGGIVKRASEQKSNVLPTKLSYHSLPYSYLLAGFWREAFISTLVLSLIVLIAFTVLLILFRRGINEIFNVSTDMEIQT